MLTSQRKAHILKLLKSDGQIVAKTLSQTLGLSEDTIRRDLRELAAEGLLQRVHGGALPSSPAVAGYADRQQLATAGKAAIGRAAARMVRPGQIVFLDGGTTAVQVARHLPGDLVATVVTHSPSIAVELVEHPGITVELIGGRLFKHSIVTVGAAALEAIGRYHPDLYFMGVTGIHPELGLTTGDSEEAAIKRAISRASAETVVLASAEKLGAASPYRVVPLTGIESIIVESEVPAELRAKLDELGITFVMA
ncbi:DeoR/GlpR family DNA-binding transcription regulator [soil metagenome]